MAITPNLTSRPLISVIIPAYNASAFLRDTLRSVQSQSLPDFEVLVVDDGSTDSTPDIVRQFCAADSRFRLITVTNNGQAKARNIGLDNMQGEWVAFLDADDLLCPDSLEVLYRIAIATGARMVSGEYVEWDDSAVSQQRLLDATKDMRSTRQSEKQRSMTAEEAVEISFYQKILLNCVWGKLFDASIFRGDNGVRFIEGIYYEDLEIFHRMADASDGLVYTPAPIYLYRQHPASFMHTFSRKRLDLLRVADSIVDYCHRNHPNVILSALDRRFSANFNMLLLLESQRPEGYDDVADKCWEVVKEGRGRALRDPKVRLKNKIGALVAYMGRRAIRLMARNMKH